MKRNSEIAEICGAIVGDGWIETNKNSLYICGHPSEDKPYYDDHLIPLFSKKICKTIGKEYPYWGVYGFGVHKKKFIDKIIKLGIERGKKVYNTRSPKWIFKKKETGIGFLRGLFDADGCIFFGKSYGNTSNKFNKTYHHDARIRIGSSSKKLIEDIQIIGKTLKIEFTKIRKKKGKITKTRNNRDEYIIEINKNSEIKKWFESFKLSSNFKHISKYLIWKKYGFCPPKTTLLERRKILKGDINPYIYYCGGAGVVKQDYQEYLGLDGVEKLKVLSKLKLS